MRTVEEIIDGLQTAAVAAAHDNKRIVKFVLATADYDRVHESIKKVAQYMSGEPAFDAKYFLLATAAGNVRVEPSDNLPIGEARVELGLRSRGRTIDAVYQDVKELLERHYGKKTTPLPQRLSLFGKWRVYFNRHGAEPLMWCVSPDDGGWEMAVRDVQLAASAETVYRKKSTPDEEDGRPSAWFSVEGVLTISAAGFAVIGQP